MIVCKVFLRCFTHTILWLEGTINNVPRDRRYIVVPLDSVSRAGERYVIPSLHDLNVDGQPGVLRWPKRKYVTTKSPPHKINITANKILHIANKILDTASKSLSGVDVGCRVEDYTCSNDFVSVALLLSLCATVGFLDVVVVLRCYAISATLTIFVVRIQIRIQ